MDSLSNWTHKNEKNMRGKKKEERLTHLTGIEPDVGVEPTTLR